VNDLDKKDEERNQFFNDLFKRFSVKKEGEGHYIDKEGSR